MFVDGEFRLEQTSLCLLTLPFQLTELLCDTAEPGCWLHCTGCTMAERGMLVKDRTKVVIVVGDRATFHEITSERSCLKVFVSIFLRQWYRKDSGSRSGTDTASLHKIAVWSDVSP